MSDNKTQLYHNMQCYLASCYEVPLQIIAHVKTFQNKNEFESAYNQYNELLHQTLQQTVKNPKRDILLEIRQTIGAIETYTDSFRESVVKTQLKERYFNQPDDKWSIRIRKFFKRARLSLKKTFIRLGNLFRKNKKTFDFHKHRIKEKRLAQHIFLNNFITKTTPFIYDSLEIRSAILIQLYTLHETLLQSILKKETLDLQKTVALIQSIENQIQNELKKINTFFESLEKSSHEEFSKHRELCGTIEFPNRKIKKYKLRRKQKKAIRKLHKTIRRSELKDFPIYQFWKIKTGSSTYLRHLELSGQKQLKALKKETEERIKADLESITLLLKKGISDLENATTKQQIEQTLLAIKEQIQQKAPLLNQKIIDLNAESYINHFLDENIEAASTFPNQILFSKNHATNKKYKAALTKTINPAELFTGMLQKKINKWLQNQKTDLLKKTQQVYQNLDEIINAVEYAFEYYNNHQGISDEETKVEILKGLTRSMNRSEENVKIVNTLHEICAEAFESYILKNTEAVSKITDPEWTAKSSRIWTHKKRSDLWAEKIKNLSIKTWPQIKKGFAKTLEFYRLTRRKYFNLRSILGIDVEKESISSELSNYLASTVYAINRLPLMYQRLFVNAPLTDTRFYTHRNTLEKNLEDARQNWQNKGYAPTCIIGEKGCGTTTLLNMFIEKNFSECEVTRISLNKKYISEKHFIDILKKHFQHIDFDNLNHFSQSINTTNNKTVIVIENIHNLFIRKNKGHDNLMAFLNLISFSNRNIFWLTSCDIYSWKYLNYAYNIQNYFGHIVEFNRLRKETITEAIGLRHKPSGFDMLFLEPENIKLKRQYNKLNQEGKQEYLKNHFFEQLHQSVQGNLSLALLFWLRSVEKVEENALYFRFKKINPSFLNNLGIQKISSLYAILIHSGLTAEEHSMVFPMNISQSENHLMLMANDAILIKKEDSYCINPLLYRPIVNYLQSANFIH